MAESCERDDEFSGFIKKRGTCWLAKKLGFSMTVFHGVSRLI